MISTFSSIAAQMAVCRDGIEALVSADTDILWEPLTADELASAEEFVRKCVEVVEIMNAEFVVKTPEELFEVIDSELEDVLAEGNERIAQSIAED